MEAMITPIQLIMLLKNQSVAPWNDSGVTDPPNSWRSITKWKIKLKNIHIATSWDMAAIINIFLVETYRCMTHKGTSRQNATKLAKPRNTPTSIIFFRRNVKKNTTEKWNTIHTNHWNPLVRAKFLSRYPSSFVCTEITTGFVPEESDVSWVSEGISCNSQTDSRERDDWGDSIFSILDDNTESQPSRAVSVD